MDLVSNQDMVWIRSYFSVKSPTPHEYTQQSPSELRKQGASKPSQPCLAQNFAEQSRQPGGSVRNPLGCTRYAPNVRSARIFIGVRRGGYRYVRECG